MSVVVADLDPAGCLKSEDRESHSHTHNPLASLLSACFLLVFPGQGRCA